MSRKKIEVVELNKKQDKIVLAEDVSPLILFWKNNSLLIFLTTLILSLTIVGISLFATIKNMNASQEPHIKEASVDVSLEDFGLYYANEPLTEATAKNSFLDNGTFIKNGEVLLTKKVENSQFTIKFYSDGTALKIMKNSDKAMRISPLANSEYGISSDGVISSNATTLDVTITKIKNVNIIIILMNQMNLIVSKHVKVNIIKQ